MINLVQGKPDSKVEPIKKVSAVTPHPLHWVGIKQLAPAKLNVRQAKLLCGVELVCFLSKTKAEFPFKDTLNELPYTDNTTETAEMGNRAIKREAVLLNSTSEWVSERVCVYVCVCVCAVKNSI